MMNKGTVADRVAAHTIAIQDSPVHTLVLLRNLVSMVKVNKKKECTMVIGKNQPIFRSKASSALCQNVWYNMKRN
jgi:ribosome biogenesis protein MAK21